MFSVTKRQLHVLRVTVKLNYKEEPIMYPQSIALCENCKYYTGDGGTTSFCNNKKSLYYNHIDICTNCATFNCECFSPSKELLEYASSLNGSKKTASNKPKTRISKVYKTLRKINWTFILSGVFTLYFICCIGFLVYSCVTDNTQSNTCQCQYCNCTHQRTQYIPHERSE